MGALSNLNLDPSVLKAISDRLGAPSPVPAPNVLPPAIAAPDAPSAPAIAPSAPAIPPAALATPAMPVQSTPATGMVAPAAAPTTPDATATPSAPTGPGPVKRVLSSLLYGAGQALVKRAGLETDAEKSHRLAAESIAQQNADTNEGYKQLQGQLVQQQASAAQFGNQTSEIPNLPAFGALAGKTLPNSIAVPLMQKILGFQSAADIAASKNASAEKISDAKNAVTLQGKQLQYGPGSYADITVTKHDGKVFLTHKRSGQEQEIGTDDALISGPATAMARARAMAAYGAFDTIDNQGNPVTISRLDALQGGAAHTPYAQAKGVLSDLVGVRQYEDILKNKITPNLGVLNDNAQRMAIAHTLAEADKNPGGLQSLLTSAVQNNVLTPEGAKLAAGIMQGREFGGVARKYGGNMNGTEGLMNRIMANQASPLNGPALNNELIANDLAFTQKAQSSIVGLRSHNAGNKGGPPQVTPQPAASETRTYMGHTYAKGADGSWQLQQ